MLRDLLNRLLRRLPKLPYRTSTFLSCAGLTFVYVTLLGMASNIAVLLTGYIITLPHLFEFILGYYMEYDDQKLWLLYLAVSQIFCTVAGGGMIAHLGASAAKSRHWYHLPDDRPDFFVMTAGVGLGTLLHGLLCVIVSRSNMAYLFFAGPVQYIARFLGKGSRALFSDVAFQLPRSTILLAILIYTILIFLGGWVGYRIGYRKQHSELVREEEERLRGEGADKTWSDEDKNQTPFAYREK